LPHDISGVSEIFPNPTVDKANITIIAMQETTLTATLYNMTGQAIEEIQINAHKGQNRIAFFTSNLTNGFYYVKIASENGGSVVKKFVIGR
jgi:hypothetical protein